MKNNEFFRALYGKEENATMSEKEALSAWFKGIREGLGFPLLTDSIREKNVSDFLNTVNEAGFKKFGYYARATNAVDNIAAFTKAGWKLTGIVEFDEYRHYEGLVFEN